MGQPCADHDRSEGEGITPQDYVLIKILLLDIPKEVSEVVKDKDTTKTKIFLAAATLRPETMYGQTNCWILPTGEYGIYEMKNGEVFICSERSALNMSYQEMTPKWGQPSKLGSVLGKAATLFFLF
jgi:leucyl-tRNA synthetase